MNRSVKIARIKRAKGLLGEVGLSLLNPSSETLRQGMSVELEFPDGRSELRKIETLYRQGTHLTCKFTGIDNRNAAEKIVGAIVILPENDLPDLGPGEYYLFQLEGMLIRSIDGRAIGTLKKITPLPHHDIYEIAAEKGEIQVPARPEFIAAISIADRCISLTQMGTEYIDGYEI